MTGRRNPMVVCRTVKTVSLLVSLSVLSVCLFVSLSTCILLVRQAEAIQWSSAEEWRRSVCQSVYQSSPSVCQPATHLYDRQSCSNDRLQKRGDGLSISQSISPFRLSVRQSVNLLLTCTTGSRDPMVVCRSVDTPEVTMIEDRI